jgi:uncharacterized integral membrane protein
MMITVEEQLEGAMEKDRRRELIRIAGAVALVLVMVAFVVDNRRSVRVGFVFTDRRVPLIGVLVVTAVLGAVIDRLLRWRHRRSKPPGE